MTVKEKLEAAKSKVKIGEKYAHYKSPDKAYRVVNVALLEADEEPCVVYQAEFGDALLWVRPFHSFFSEVDVDGKKIARFHKTC